MLKEHAISTHVVTRLTGRVQRLLAGSAKLANAPCVMVVPYREQTISIILGKREVGLFLKNTSTQKCERRQK